MKAIRNLFLSAGVLMLVYFFFAFFIFVLSAGSYIFNGAPFSEDGHAMFLNIFKLPLPVIIPCLGVVIYSIIYFFRNWK
jgi:hypothetical protein